MIYDSRRQTGQDFAICENLRNLWIFSIGISAGGSHHARHSPLSLMDDVAKFRLRKRLAGYAGIAVGVLLLLVPVGMAYVSCSLVLMATYPETLTIEETGLPRDHDRLHWSEWNEGCGDLRPSTIIKGIDADSEIVRYRIASGQNLFVKFSFYQAKYALPNGETRIAHAEGPVRLISPRTDALVSVGIVCVVTAFVLIVQGFRWIKAI